MIRIGLHHLETLFWISRLGTFTAAAERLHTTQSSVSGRVKELETRLGTKLFAREGRNMVLTPKGRELVVACEPLLGDVERVLMTASGGEAFTGIVRIGSGEIAAISCVPGFLSAMATALPRVVWTMDVELTIHLRQRLETQDLDLAFLVGPVEANYLHAHPIGRTTLRWMASAKLLERLGRKKSNLRIEQAPVWSLSKPSYQYLLAVDSMRNAGADARRISTCSSVRALIEVVRSGAGIAMLPDNLVTSELKEGSLQLLTAAPPHQIEFFVAVRGLEDDPLVKEVFKQACRHEWRWT